MYACGGHARRTVYVHAVTVYDYTQILEDMNEEKHVRDGDVETASVHDTDLAEACTSTIGCQASPDTVSCKVQTALHVVSTGLFHVMFLLHTLSYILSL
jgi:hypothetical protein